MDKYLTVNFKQNIEDFTIDNNHKLYDSVSYPAKICEQDDFGTNEQDVTLFKSWKGYEIICPDFKLQASNELLLEGFQGGLFNKNVVLSVEKC